MMDLLHRFPFFKLTVILMKNGDRIEMLMKIDHDFARHETNTLINTNRD